MKHSLHLKSDNLSDENEYENGVPILTRSGYYTEPPLEDLMRLPSEKLRAIRDFVVGCQDVGSIKFLGETDVTGIDLDAIINFEDRAVEVYPDDYPEKPPVGQGLNKPAEITLYHCWPTDKISHQILNDPQSLSFFEEKLRKRCDEFNGSCSFGYYAKETGVWVFTVEHFTKYGLDDDSDNDDQIIPTKPPPILPLTTTTKPPTTTVAPSTAPQTLTHPATMISEK